MEDDLIISPDFLSFFHQTARVLDTDPSVYFVSAHRKHSRSGLRWDPRLLLRGDAVPMWGWMVRRDIIKDWVAPDSGVYWSYHLLNTARHRRHHSLYPQLSRSLHGGSGGSNVKGFAQAKNPYEEVANLLPDVEFLNIDRLDHESYAADFNTSLSMAQALPLTKPTPCEQGFIPEGQKGPFIIFVHNKDDYYSVLDCFNGYTMGGVVDHREAYEGVLQLDLQQGIIYIVNCPWSAYCYLKPPDFPAIQLGEEFMEASTALKAFKRHWQLRQLLKLRTTSTDFPEKHFQLENFAKSYNILGIDLNNIMECNGVILPILSNVSRNEKFPSGDSNHSNSEVHELSGGISKVKAYYPSWDCTGPTVGSDTLLHMPHAVSAALKHMNKLAYKNHSPKPQLHEFNLEQFYTWDTDTDPRFTLQ
ncbi:unnamed protein product, partial [Meganyctiphanes norvegica]